MVNEIISLDKLEYGHIFAVPHSLNWYMCTEVGYINLDTGLLVPRTDYKYWGSVLLLYDRLGDIALDAEEHETFYLTEWWSKS